MEADLHAIVCTIRDDYLPSANEHVSNISAIRSDPANRSLTLISNPSSIKLFADLNTSTLRTCFTAT